MASAIDLSALTLNPQEATDVSEVIFERLYQYGMLSQFHEVETGVHYRQKIVFADRMGLVGKLSTGCTPNTAGGFAFSEKEWAPVREDFRIEHCAADVAALQKIFQRAQRMNPDFYDAIGRNEIGVVVAAVLAAMEESIHAKVWFNDTAAADNAGGGVFTNGSDLGIFNTFDGIFKQIEGDADITKVVIAGNTATGQRLDAGESQATLQEMYEKADSRLLTAPGTMFQVTRSIWDNWMANIEEREKNGGFIEKLENGMMTAKYRGIPVYMREDWDRTVAGYQNNAGVFNKPHRAVLTVKENTPIATVNDSDFQELDSFYDKTAKTNYIDAVYTIDAKVLEPYMIVATN